VSDACRGVRGTQQPAIGGWAEPKRALRAVRLSGTLLSAILQSSTATVMMLVGFANTGLLSLPRAMSLLLGAGIGTTLVVQVMSFKLSQAAMLIVVIGFVLQLLK
jgi:phosphate:Na+ symporter